MRRVLCLMVAALLAGCMPERELKNPALGYAPEATSDGWTITSAEQAGIPAATLAAIYERFYAEDEFLTSSSLLIVHAGSLVAEGYAHSLADRDQIQNVQSITKSVLSILIGQAVDAGQLTTATTLAQLLPQAESTVHANVTLDDLLTMRSGIAYDNDVHVRELVVERPADSLQFVLDLPQEFAPGTRFRYNDAAPHLAAAMLQAATGTPVQNLAATMMGQLGVQDWLWEQHDDGRVYGGFGLHLRPRDLARIGVLMEQQGQWQDEQRVSAGWVTQSTTARANLNEGPYGYYWWSRPDFRAFAGFGHGGNVLYVMPDLDIVVVHTALPYADGLGASTEDFEDLIAILRAGMAVSAE